MSVFVSTLEALDKVIKDSSVIQEGKISSGELMFIDFIRKIMGDEKIEDNPMIIFRKLKSTHKKSFFFYLSLAVLVCEKRDVTKSTNGIHFEIYEHLKRAENVLRQQEKEKKHLAIWFEFVKQCVDRVTTEELLEF